MYDRSCLVDVIKFREVWRFFNVVRDFYRFGWYYF